jgi:hypothetical protein
LYCFGYGSNNPAYIIGPGCSMENTVITSGNWSTVLPSPSVVYLLTGPTLTVTAP